MEVLVQVRFRFTGVRVLVQFRTFRVQNLLFEVISKSFCIIFGQETHEHVKTIKKRCLEAKYVVFGKNDLAISMFSRRVSLPGVRRPIEGCFV